MNDKDLTTISTNTPANTTGSVSPTRAKSFKVNSPHHNFAQYVNTIKAYALAGMPFEHIANAGDSLGDLVERGEVDAPILEGWQEKAGEIAEDESKVLAWQNRREVITLTPQLAAPTNLSNTEVAPINNDLVVNQNLKEQKLNVVEGIAVFNPNSSQLENNPFLKALPDIKKGV